MPRFAVFRTKPVAHTNDINERVEVTLAYMSVNKERSVWVEGEHKTEGYMPAVFLSVEQAKEFIDTAKKGDTKEYFFIQEILY